MKLEQVHNVYFLGIGGIGMSALASYFLFSGKKVGGYDRTPNDRTQALQSEGAQIHFEDDISKIPADFTQPENTLVVYTPALPDSHTELTYYRQNDFHLAKRSEVLGMIANPSYCMAVAGTHGKTTTSCILAHLLNEAQAPYMAFLGGVSEDLGNNFALNGTDYAVVEADEFDRSFLRLTPDIACITAMDADHLDIYGAAEELTAAFEEFIALQKPGGKSIIRYGLPIPGITYGEEAEATYRATNIRLHQGAYQFDIEAPGLHIKGCRFTKPGRHNLMNALAAFALGVESGFDPNILAKALGTFKGVARRFSYQIKTSDFVYIDDYAHHPTEIDAVHQAVSELYPDKRNTVVFQPHLFSRTQDFADDFARSLAQFDHVLLLEIYPARELPIPGVDANWLLNKIENPNKKLVTKAELVHEVRNINPDILLTLGAGDIGNEVTQLKTALSHGN
ncbi:UDP-N-acetylmuramate--L-alanine ligase [Sediminicola luteus]|uniref:UDP-N-acetylmuramate--L-alanine ligase n=1 Tax=Sediminicola luteus TaxID=319238 RepID=A0A2A4G6L0_9FLAO|nr:UDP-N-acetylmuramate--L-alanine ligase [Sediminicola luteus]PCE63385.1 UDP-N-acetylmuramate--L-alanine ligase [Sediminicola luteus]